MITKIDNGEGGTLLSPELAESVSELLESSFTEIDFKYEWLTPQEKQSLTEEEFECLVAWIKNNKED